jgi:pyruvate dehydrogenase E2 component (dihydrolipoamide acetyltransferase)
VRASPAARRLAADKGIDLSGLTGSGPGGAVVYQDVAKAAKQPARHPSGGLDLDAMREAIAAAMARSKREIPHYYLSHSFDVGAAVDWLAAYNKHRPPQERLLMGALLVKAVALALSKYGEFNGFFEDGHFHAADGIHVGTAIAIRGGGLAAPAIHDVDTLPLGDLMAKLRDLVARTRAGRLRSSEMTDPTVTVSSLGERGVEALYGVIYPPQVALIGFGRIETRPWATDDATLSPRPVMTATLAADHRVSDGHRGALFLLEIEKRLNEPEAL